MNFLGMGPGELVLIATLGLIVFGPGKLPEIAAQVGRAVRDFRRSTTDITAEFQRSFSLEEPPPAEAPAGAAEVFAANGAAAVEATHGSPAAVGTSEPPLADTSQWHWESNGSEQQAGSAAPASAEHPPPVPPFWQWDTPASAEPRAAVSGIWEWDPPAPRQPATDGGRS